MGDHDSEHGVNAGAHSSHRPPAVHAWQRESCSFAVLLEMQVGKAQYKFRV